VCDDYDVDQEKEPGRLLRFPSFFDVLRVLLDAALSMLSVMTNTPADAQIAKSP
jgi:hypothetical protein